MTETQENTVQPNSHIKLLPQDVINRIAAGEVVQRPASAVKELLENCLDAGATQIQIVCEDGGLGLLQISDNGSGIGVIDFPLLCERFATSKISSFEDLSKIQTFGFRGEALASISHVAKVTVVSMTANAPYAHHAKYRDGAMIEGPTPIAGTQGTTIKVEDLFFNSEVRRNCFSKSSEEYSKIVEVVKMYALMNPTTAFSCKKLGSNTSDLNFGKSGTTMERLKTEFGNELLQNLVEVSNSSDVHNQSETKNSFQFHGYVSTPTYQSKRLIFILFINGRLVDSKAVRRAVDQAYAPHLVGGQRPFSFLSLRLPADQLDVNIHPTKREVLLLNEDHVVFELFQSLSKALRSSLTIRNSSELLANRTSTSSSSALPRSLSSGGGGGALTISPLNVSHPNLPGVTLAPCTMVRVEKQQGDLLRHLAKIPTLNREEMWEKDAGIQNTKSTTAQVAPPRVSSLLIDVDEQEAHGEGTIRPSDDRPEHSPTSRSQTFEKVCIEVDDLGTERALEGADRILAEANACAESQLTFIGSILEQVVPKPLAIPSSNSRDGEDRSFFRVPSVTLDAEEDYDDDVGRDFKRQTEAQGASSTAYPVALNTLNDQKPFDSTQLPKAYNSAELIRNNAQDASSPTGVNDPELLNQIPTSVTEFCESFLALSSEECRAFAESLSFVGCLNSRQFLAQGGTTLYLVDVERLVEVLVFQRIFVRWGQHGVMEFDGPRAPDVGELIAMHLAYDPTPKNAFSAVVLAAQNVSAGGEQAARFPSVSSQDREVMRCKSILMKWRDMLSEYFCIDISSDAQLLSLPMPLGPSWAPCLDFVPAFLYALVNDVDYASEKSCFSGIAKIIARLYRATVTRATSNSSAEGDTAESCAKGSRTETASKEADVEEDNNKRTQSVEGVDEPIENKCQALLQTLRGKAKCYLSTEDITGGMFHSIITVEALYRVFERC